MICRRGEIFEKYYRLLAEWNQKFNLTAITERDEVFVKHFADSLLGEEFVGENASVLDVGTGAGFPSLPIKIVRDDISLTLVDSLQKRINFLNCVLSELDIKKAEALHARAEDLSCRETFDCAVSRAVAPLSTLCEYCLPFVKTGGVFIAYKAENCEEEVASSSKAAEILGGRTRGDFQASPRRKYGALVCDNTQSAPDAGCVSARQKFTAQIAALNNSGVDNRGV